MEPVQNEPKMTDAIIAELLIFVQSLSRWKTPALAPDSSLFESQRLDSMNFSELVGFVETQYQITIRARDMIPENFDTIDRLANLVRELQTR